MTLSTLRPSSTSSNSGSVTGAGSAHAALSDNSDSSYVDFDNFEQWNGGVDDLTLPAGAMLKNIAIRARVAAAIGIPRGGATFPAADSHPVLGSPFITWGSPTTITFATGSPAVFTDSAIDAGTLSLVSGPSAGATTRFYEAYVDVTYVTQPTVSVNVPTGTITDTNRPTVTWSDTLDGDGGPQTVYQVRVFTDAQYSAGGFNPATSTPTLETDANGSLAGVVFGAATSWQTDGILPDDTYRAYVRVGQSVGFITHWSDWDYTEFAIDVALPGVPDLVVAPDNDNARIQLDISEGIGDATTDFYEIEYSTDLGATYMPLRRLPGLLGPGDATLFDYEAPNGYVQYYRARAVHDYGGAYAVSDWAPGGGIWDNPSWWLKHPSRPDLNTPVAIHSFPSVNRAGRMGTFQPLGATAVVVVSDTRGPKTGQLVLRSDTETDEAALDVLLDTQATLFLDGPIGESGPGYVRISDHDRQRFVDRSNPGAILEQLSFVAVTRPAGDVIAWPP